MHSVFAHPAEPGFHAGARACVIDLAVVRRRKVDVAADIPARRVADLPVDLDDADSRSIHDAERELADSLVSCYQTALATRNPGIAVDGIDDDLVRQVAGSERTVAVATRRHLISHPELILATAANDSSPAAFR
jgi:hypothetical protein